MKKLISLIVIGTMSIIIAMLVLALQNSTRVGSGSALILQSAMLTPVERDSMAGIEDLDTQGFAPPTYTFQGLLNDVNGDPVVGPIDVEVRLQAIDDFGFVEILVSEQFFGVMLDQGRFQLNLGFPTPQELIDANLPHVSIVNLATGTVMGGSIILHHTPMAYTAELAAHASSADTLSGDESVLLAPEFPFVEYGFGYEPPRATKSGRTVTLTGMVDVIGIGAVGDRIVTLPVNMRPEGRLLFMVYHRDILGQLPVGRVDVHANGRVTMQNPSPGPTRWVSLAGISFTAAE
jgi:hypothetical protein